MKKQQKKSGAKSDLVWSIHSIGTKIIILVFACLLISLIVTDAYVIPKAKDAVSSATENNMLDLSTVSSQLVDMQVDELGKDKVTVSSLKEVIGDKDIANVSSSYIYVVDKDGKFLYHPKNEKVGTVVFNDDIMNLLKQIPSGKYEEAKVFHYTDENGVVKYASYQVSKKTGWVTVMVADEKDILASMNRMTYSNYIIMGITSLILLMIAIVLAARIRNPILALTTIIKRTSKLDFSESEDMAKLVQRKDETGDISRATKVMQEGLTQMVETLKGLSDNLKNNSNVLEDATGQINEVSTDNSATTEELAASMEETSATMDTIANNTSSIRDNAEAIDARAVSGLNLAKEIEGRADDMNANITETNQKTIAMYQKVKVKTEEALHQAKSVSKINELASTIREIADQTSLLALNASIEAARAGEQGRGFAVVAGEIGSLASQSTNTVEGIMEIINEVNDAVKHMDECLTESLDFLENEVITDYEGFMNVSKQYDKDAKSVNTAMNEIYDEIQELKKTAEQIVSSVEDINVTVGEAAEGVTDIAEKTTDVVTQSQHMVNIVDGTKKCADDIDGMAQTFIL